MSENPGDIDEGAKTQGMSSCSDWSMQNSFGSGNHCGYILVFVCNSIAAARVCLHFKSESKPSEFASGGFWFCLSYFFFSFAHLIQTCRSLMIIYINSGMAGYWKNGIGEEFDQEWNIKTAMGCSAKRIKTVLV